MTDKRNEQTNSKERLELALKKSPTISNCRGMKK